MSIICLVSVTMKTALKNNYFIIGSRTDYKPYQLNQYSIIYLHTLVSDNRITDLFLYKLFSQKPNRKPWRDDIDLDEMELIGRKNMQVRVRVRLQEKTRAAAAPRKPKNGAVSSPLKLDILDRGSATTSFGDLTISRLVSESSELLISPSSLSSSNFPGRRGKGRNTCILRTGRESPTSLQLDELGLTRKLGHRWA